MDRNSSIERIKVLIDKYTDVLKQGRISEFNEEMTKKDFILPLFDALGWHTTDSKEVSAEERVSRKRVDYGFRINDIPKFFLEAKSFKEDLDTRKFIDQAINYAWHKGCTWAILTNFESIKIFNAEVKTDHPWLSQFKPTLHCNEFLMKFDELLLLSKDSFEKGLLDEEAEKWGKKAKKTAIDKQLLEDFTKFRYILSKNITKLNEGKQLSEEELDESVQRLLDRLIFIRNCEDRELEPKILISNYREWESKGRGQLIRSLRETFAYFDNQYNSKIFSQHLCDDLDVDNEVLHEVIEGLYNTKDNEPYDFSIIDADVLGTIYEQYLGHILKKTEKRAKLTENHAHRKEQGIYYTPPHIVNYIVRNTLGELLKEKNVEVEQVKILDPSCGSGSFLIKAFDFLNAYYQKNDPNYKQTKLDLDTGIPFKTKSRILQNNIFGVDLDKQAIEIAQLNLLLKIAEKGHRLPLLEQNVRLGNSIIDDEAIAGDKAFKWEEKFENIMKEGFDVIIGNPPYGAELTKNERRFILNNYPATENNTDTAIAFMNKAYNLLKTKGYMGLIVPKPLIYSQKWIACRDFIENDLIKIVDVSKAFADVLLEQVIIIAKKGSNSRDYFVDFIDRRNEPTKISKSVAHKFGNFINDVSQEELSLAIKLNKGKHISDIAVINRGLGIQDLLKSSGDIPILRGKNIGRYLIKHPNEFILKEDYHKIRGDLSYLLRPKIVIQNIVAHVIYPKDHIVLMAAIDRDGLLALDNVGCINMLDSNIDMVFLVALLNSTLMSWYAYRFIYGKAIRTMRLDKYHIGKMPLCDYGEASEYSKIVMLGNQILSYKKRLGDKKTDKNKNIEIEIEKAETKIDDLIYRNYGLTEAEAKVIKGSLKKEF
jgi:type I restriction-modification system DNA methylase subunit